MADRWPKITDRRVLPVSPWMQIVERDVQFAPGRHNETYHAVAQADYVSVLAVTPDDQIPIVRQYRPALEQYTWELPAGLVDRSEDPAAACERELLEETGYPSRTVRRLGVTSPCSGRMSNRLHAFFVETGARNADFRPEPGIDVRLVSLPELADMIRSGAFVSQLHIGTIAQAALQTLIELPSGRILRG
jgi:ADP-ribose pyrophosphatase